MYNIYNICILVFLIIIGISSTYFFSLVLKKDITGVKFRKGYYSC